MAIIFAINDGKNAVNVSSISVMAVDYIQRNFTEAISLDNLAEKLGISPFYLSKIIKRSTGRNFTDLISELRIEKARELLKTDLSIKEVTYKSGFNSQNYFSKIFRKYVGVTPTEYKSLQFGKKWEEDR